MVPTEDYRVQACWSHTKKRLDRLVVTATSRLETILVHGRDFGQLPAYAFKRRMVMQQSDCSACMKKSCINPGHRANILRQNRVYTVHSISDDNRRKSLGLVVARVHSLYRSLYIDDKHDVDLPAARPTFQQTLVTRATVGGLPVTSSSLRPVSLKPSPHPMPYPKNASSGQPVHQPKIRFFRDSPSC